MERDPADPFMVTVRTGIDYDTGAIGMTVETPWDLATQTATRIMQTQEKATREALIALGWTPPAERPVGQPEDGVLPLSLRLALAEVASCWCSVKTDEPRFHDSRCLYRLLREAQEEVEQLAVLRSAMASIEDDYMTSEAHHPGYVLIPTGKFDELAVLGGARRYLIRKGGYYYRPNAQGYTSVKAEAGRYTLAEAISYSHPNGPDGPRDGIDYVPADADGETKA